MVQTRSRLATERMHVSVVRVERRPKPSRVKSSRVKFCALEGDLRVEIEADSEDDARLLCQEAGLDFIGLCDD
ncbi:hypothetical protein AUC69_08380 [Methyloceanibacter superfactus]|jgi:hypothetical protein|uniref:Uncharacterized protein n=1 Tax=Methyloceanibacter superfactus TaxID=1774969 RepID=A0A1E3W1E9_9HYPH|nr:hypothetical protein [Methyloceanibacter superfactus]ODR99635.1 hypothetical protein AUC69_08380 [Methyloceanibacter superfactus]